MAPALLWLKVNEIALQIPGKKNWYREKSDIAAVYYITMLRNSIFLIKYTWQRDTI